MQSPTDYFNGLYSHSTTQNLGVKLGHLFFKRQLDRGTVREHPMMQYMDSWL